ncbi:hypothetical protein V1Y59_20080 [Gordonia sp. PKS22-38]|uniref:Uncharacterized protein n=1 Tax=Gordonia prachuapensis TaxID=3115651 RepID=A0ABU7MYI0_9ACTN|nr:hypothetical protein [Gordonia sp. PKS22-38]
MKQYTASMPLCAQPSKIADAVALGVTDSVQKHAMGPARVNAMVAARGRGSPGTTTIATTAAEMMTPASAIGQTAVTSPTEYAITIHVDARKMPTTSHAPG